MTETEAKCIAQAQHLLAQIKLQLDDSNAARDLGKDALNTRLKFQVDRTKINLSYIEILGRECDPSRSSTGAGGARIEK